MADIPLVQPDLNFKRQLLGLGARNLTACYQCGTCTVVCPISTPDNPFPRNEMILAQWGLRERLASDLSLWLCHNCNDCTAYCPRGANPGDVMAAIRNYLIVYFAVPRFLARSLSSPAYFLLALGILVFLAWLPLDSLQGAFFVVTGLALVATLNGLRRFWRSLHQWEGNPGAGRTRSGAAGEPGAGGAPNAGGGRGLLASLDSATTEILSHANFAKCSANKGNHLAHLLVFYGFVGLFITCLGAQVYAMTGAGLPLPLTNPMKIFGIASGLALSAGLTIMIYRRLFRKGQASKGTYFDWFFIVSLYLVTITGLVMPFLRVLGATAWVHSVYLLHLGFLFLSVACLPFSKAAHPLYRMLAMIYARRIGIGVEARLVQQDTGPRGLAVQQAGHR